MPVERTFSIVKPDAVAKNVIGKIYTHFEDAGLSIIAAKMINFSDVQAQAFYDEHKERPFFADLVEFMTSGPVMLQVLEGEDAIRRNRQLMGATNPEEADKGTIRAIFGDATSANAVHGSDSPTSAKREIALFFSDDELFSR